MRRVRTFLANDSAAASDSTSALARRYGARTAINASYFNVTTLYPTTFVKDNRKQEGWTMPEELRRVDGIIAFKGNKVEIFHSDTLSYAALTGKYREAMAAGPMLLKDGVEARPDWPSKDKFYIKRHPRTLIGTTADGWVYWIVIDGRFPGQGIGTTIHETAEVARMFGLKDALNLDGGGSSVLWTQRFGVISHPYDNRRFDPFGQRVVPNIIYVR